MIKLDAKTAIPECKQLRSLQNYLQFEQVIDKPTRIASSSSTLLDIVVTVLI